MDLISAFIAGDMFTSAIWLLREAEGYDMQSLL
jgi:hypothetical protein